MRGPQATIDSSSCRGSRCFASAGPRSPAWAVPIARAGCGPNVSFRRIRGLGGYAIWLDPRKRCGRSGTSSIATPSRCSTASWTACLPPTSNWLAWCGRERSRGRAFHAVFGLDMHDELHPRCVWVECEVASLRTEVLVERSARVASSTGRGGVRWQVPARSVCRITSDSRRSDPRSGPGTGSLLLPDGPRRAFVCASRPIVRLLKPRTR